MAGYALQRAASRAFQGLENAARNRGLPFNTQNRDFLIRVSANPVIQNELEQEWERMTSERNGMVPGFMHCFGNSINNDPLFVPNLPEEQQNLDQYEGEINQESNQQNFVAEGSQQEENLCNEKETNSGNVGKPPSQFPGLSDMFRYLQSSLYSTFGKIKSVFEQQFLMDFKYHILGFILAGFVAKFLQFSSFNIIDFIGGELSKLFRALKNNPPYSSQPENLGLRELFV